MIRIFGERLLIKRVQVENVTSGGLYIPEAVQSTNLESVVIAAGDEVKKVQVGDHVLVGKYAGTPFTIDGQEHFIVGEWDILGQITSDSQQSCLMTETTEVLKEDGI